MDFVKVKEANAACGALIGNALKTRSFRDSKQRKLLEHCLDMIEQMSAWPATRLEKSFRWLGYIQGVMEALDVADLETLKKMNAPTEVDTARENEAKEKSKTEALKLADKLEKFAQYQPNHGAFLLECVAALRGELPEPPDAEHPFNVLSKELHERLHPTTAHGLRDASTEELVSLTNLAERLEQVKREQKNHRETLTSLKGVAGVFGDWLKKAPETPVDRTDRAVRAVCRTEGLIITLSTEREILMPWDWYPKLAGATDTQRAHFRLIDNGAGIHWSDVDEDLSVSAIVDRAVS